ncbi:DUF2254 domain-containing protein [Aeoliella sp. ICT_H6.2]|uniref:DUF2254 domain-containing protein n=1 Tax=Aeoliella straminimaris TaxID=2954799 RepID=A0A9X2JKS3_9BACT|nr:DUF2254 domain-containing protein [Aeoliella straminimaris]MCO6047264.1 DUF2254 domain-containing protein [Aeoliella straminimaris]
MRTWIVNLWDSFRTGFWFFPTLLILLAAVLAFAVPAIDGYLDPSLPDWMKTTGTTARSTLATLASAMFTVAGVVFSVTVVTLSITSSQFGSRLLRNFLQQSITQVTLGSCLAASIYCLLLLWRVDDVNDDWFVPHLAVLLATVLSLFTLCLVVYFIHRIAYSVQSMNVVTDVAADLNSAIQRIFPKKSDTDSQLQQKRKQLAGRFENNGGHSVTATSEGYLQAVNVEQLTSLADSRQLFIHVTRRPGEFLAAGDTVAYYLEDGDSDAEVDEVQQHVSNCFLFGNQRTPRQDVECAIAELTEIAVRALSPGINDPHTAIASIDRLSGSLCQLTQYNLSSALRIDVGDDETLRVLGTTTSLDAVLRAAFDQIRQYGASSVAVSVRLLEALARIAERAETTPDKAAIRRQADLVLEGCDKQEFCQEDLQDVHQRHETVARLCE